MCEIFEITRHTLWRHTEENLACFQQFVHFGPQRPALAGPNVCLLLISLRRPMSYAKKSRCFTCRRWRWLSAWLPVSVWTSDRRRWASCWTRWAGTAEGRILRDNRERPDRWTYKNQSTRTRCDETWGPFVCCWSTPVRERAWSRNSAARCRRPRTGRRQRHLTKWWRTNRWSEDFQRPTLPFNNEFLSLLIWRGTRKTNCCKLFLI